MTYDILSSEAAVNMAVDWYEITDLKHFWIRRRFEVLCDFAGKAFVPGRQIAEIGCGNGLLQRQIEDHFGLTVAGFDLNSLALESNIARMSPVSLYNIFDRHPDHVGRYDLLLLFDVLEHIEDEISFLRAALDHAKPGADVLVHLPAGHNLYSDYDRTVGHLRRYELHDLERLCAAGVRLTDHAYWGHWLRPVLVIRKLLLSITPRSRVVEIGFRPPSRLGNVLLHRLARFRPVMAEALGTSLLAWYVKA